METAIENKEAGTDTASDISSTSTPIKQVESNSLSNFFKHAEVQTVEKAVPEFTSSYDSDEDDDAVEIVDKDKSEAKSVKAKNLSANLQAKLYTSIWSSSLAMGFGYAHKRKAVKKLISVSSFSGAIELFSKVEAGVIKKEELSKQEQMDYIIVKKFNEKLEDLPLDSDEAAMMEENLAAIIVENDYKMPPSIGIAIIMGSSILTRGMQYFFE